MIELTTKDSWADFSRRANLTVPHSPHREEAGERKIPRGQDLAPAPIDGMYDKWFFISGAAV